MRRRPTHAPDGRRRKRPAQMGVVRPGRVLHAIVRIRRRRLAATYLLFQYKLSGAPGRVRCGLHITPHGYPSVEPSAPPTEERISETALQNVAPLGVA